MEISATGLLSYNRGFFNSASSGKASFAGSAYLRRPGGARPLHSSASCAKCFLLLQSASVLPVRRGLEIPFDSTADG
jgi:hypothetical protein